MLHIIITTLLGIFAFFFGLVSFFALRRINKYESIILNIYDRTETIKIQLKLIDDKGHFEADDEVGFFWDEMKELSSQLSELFELESIDGVVNEKENKKDKKKEK
jgi:hypothetical protein